MPLKKALFILATLLLFVNIIILNTDKTIYTGTISTIKYSNNKITIILKNNPNSFILFTNQILNLKKNDQIKITGQKSIYNNQPQIVVNKLTKVIP